MRLGVVVNDRRAAQGPIEAYRQAVEAAFGEPLYWQRLDDKRASRISLTVAGGWADESSWPGAFEKAIDAMKRLYAATHERVNSFLKQQ